MQQTEQLDNPYVSYALSTSKEELLNEIEGYLFEIGDLRNWREAGVTEKEIRLRCETIGNPQYDSKEVDFWEREHKGGCGGFSGDKFNEEKYNAWLKDGFPNVSGSRFYGLVLPTLVKGFEVPTEEIIKVIMKAKEKALIYSRDVWLSDVKWGLRWVYDGSDDGRWAEYCNRCYGLYKKTCLALNKEPIPYEKLQEEVATKELEKIEEKEKKKQEGEQRIKELQKIPENAQLIDVKIHTGEEVKIYDVDIQKIFPSIMPTEEFPYSVIILDRTGEYETHTYGITKETAEYLSLLTNKRIEKE